MAVKCPETGEYVLYTECLECEARGDCGRHAVEKPVFALLVVGSRSVTDYAYVSRTIDRLIAPIRYKYRFLIVSGGARGADSLAEIYAREHGMDFHMIPAEWSKFGRSAGFIRNDAMHRYISGFEHRGVIAFWNGEKSSRGTLHSIPLAKQYGNPLRFINIKKRDAQAPEKKNE